MGGSCGPLGPLLKGGDYLRSRGSHWRVVKCVAGEWRESPDQTCTVETAKWKKVGIGREPE